MAAQRETVAVLGTGTMGLPIARNLARAGFPLRAWNRTRERAEPLAAEGATVCDTPAEAAADAGVLLTMLPDADAVLAVADGPQGALAGAREDAVWLQMSTIGIAGTERCAALARERGIAFADAPVLGTKQPAEEAKLAILASGPAETRERLAPLFDAIGAKALWLGEAGAGTRLKLVTNTWLVAVVAGAAEAIRLAEGIGVDPEDFFEALAGGALDLPYLQLKGRAMVARDFEPTFKLALATKDAGLALEAAGRHDVDVPVLDEIHRRMAQAAERHGDEDVAATLLAGER
jgi:3-hydroxyisobutyrate dehydrogenase